MAGALLTPSQVVFAPFENCSQNSHHALLKSCGLRLVRFSRVLCFSLRLRIESGSCTGSHKWVSFVRIEFF
jgi:hypothetical protein